MYTFDFRLSTGIESRYWDVHKKIVPRIFQDVTIYTYFRLSAVVYSSIQTYQSASKYLDFLFHDINQTELDAPNSSSNKARQTGNLDSLLSSSRASSSLSPSRDFRSFASFASLDIFPIECRPCGSIRTIFRGVILDHENLYHLPAKSKLSGEQPRLGYGLISRHCSCNWHVKISLSSPLQPFQVSWIDRYQELPKQLAQSLQHTHSLE